MRCNGESCLSIVNEYATKKGSINNSLNNMKSDIASVSDTLNSLSVPEDYVGGKVKARLEEIYNTLSSNAESISAYDNEVSFFVDEKMKEHKDHYQAWKRRQEELELKAKLEREKDISES